jgi:hypothetical protein
VVANLQLHGSQRVGDDAYSVLICPLSDHGALVVDELLEDHDVALDLVPGGVHDVQAFVEHQLLTSSDVGDLDRGMQVDLHLAALREDVHRAVLVLGQVDAVGRGWRAELVHLFLQRCDLLAGVGERVDQRLVGVEGLLELAFGIAQLALQDHQGEIP